MEELSLQKALVPTKDGVTLGIFQPNMQANSYMSTSPGLTQSNWESNRRVAVLADEIGISFALTVGRWKGVPGDSIGYAMFGIDTYTLAAALLDATKRIAIFSTTHCPVWNPVIAAKLGADIDHISGGRWGINIVAGWSEAEFRSMGLTLFDHEKRYTHAADWLAAVRELWVKGESSYDCEFFQLDRAECNPRPLQQGGPLVVNAGMTPVGLRFAIANCDFLFSPVPNWEEFRAIRDELERDIGFIGHKRVIIAETDAEANNKAADIIAKADRRAIAGSHYRPVRDDGTFVSLDDVVDQLGDPELLRQVVMGGAAIGSAETVARQLGEWAAESSADGICMALYDYQRSLELLASKGFEILGNTLADRGKRLVLTC